jgi:hypothetical protein
MSEIDMRVRRTLMGRTMKLYFALLNWPNSCYVTIRNPPVNNNHKPNYHEKRWIRLGQEKEVKITWHSPTSRRSSR